MVPFFSWTPPQIIEEPLYPATEVSGFPKVLDQKKGPTVTYKVGHQTSYVYRSVNTTIVNTDDTYY